MSLLRRRMMMEKSNNDADIKYPLVDGIYPQGRYINYEVKNGTIYFDAGTSRFCLTTPSIPYSSDCVNNESWIITAGSKVLFEVDNLCELLWRYRTIDNSNIDAVNGEEMILSKDIKNILAIGNAVSGEANIKFYVNGERWI